MQFTVDDSQLRALLHEVAEAAAVSALERYAKLHPEPSGERLISEPEAAALLGVSRHTLGEWRRHGLIECTVGTKPVKYTHADVQRVLAWMKTRCDSSMRARRRGNRYLATGEY